MEMATKLPQIQTFMGQEDERTFSKALREAFPGMVFIDKGCWPDPAPRVYDSIVGCSDSHGQITLLNTQICSLEDYAREYVVKNKWHDYYESANVGRGLIQYLRSKPWNIEHQGLNNGRLAASYDLEKEPEMDAYVKSVFRVFKKGATKLYYLNPETWQINERPTTVFFAWPEAIKQYDCVDGKYLICHSQAYFTSIKSPHRLHQRHQRV
jgi:hypothetical protein